MSSDRGWMRHLAILVALLTGLHMLFVRAAAVRAVVIVITTRIVRIARIVIVLVALLASLDVLLVRATAIVIASIWHGSFLPLKRWEHSSAGGNGGRHAMFLHVSTLHFTKICR